MSFPLEVRLVAVQSRSSKGDHWPRILLPVVAFPVIHVSASCVVECPLIHGRLQILVKFVKYVLLNSHGRLSREGQLEDGIRDVVGSIFGDDDAIANGIRTPHHEVVGHFGNSITLVGSWTMSPEIFERLATLSDELKCHDALQAIKTCSEMCKYRRNF